MKVLRRFFILALCFLASSSSYAFWGELIEHGLNPQNEKENWLSTDPKIVVGIGWLEDSLRDYYERYLQAVFAPKVSEAFPTVRVEMIRRASGRDLVHALQNPDTIGLIFFSHTYVEKRNRTVAIGADGYALPMGILSAASPALRFAALFGCHGKGFSTQYQAEYELARLPGNQRFFANKDRYLSANCLGHRPVTKLLGALLQRLKTFLPQDLLVGVDPPVRTSGTLTLYLKEGETEIVPEYVYVNNRIVGITPNKPKELGDVLLLGRAFAMSIPDYALSAFGKKLKLKIEAPLSIRGPFQDNYILLGAHLETPSAVFEKSSGATRVGAPHLGEGLAKIWYDATYSGVFLVEDLPAVPNLSLGL